MTRLLPATLAGLILCAPFAAAETADLTPGVPGVEVQLKDRALVIERRPDPSASLPVALARALMQCPPACLQPLEAAPGVQSLAELELITFLRDEVSGGAGLLVDLRPAAEFAAGTLPGAVNIPAEALAPENPFRPEILQLLGGVPKGAGMEFPAPVRLVAFAEGPWSAAGPGALRALIEAGYPADHLGWYRGGLQDWALLGLTTTQPGE